jgi:hypothetical protein
LVFVCIGVGSELGAYSLVDLKHRIGRACLIHIPSLGSMIAAISNLLIILPGRRFCGRVGLMGKITIYLFEKEIDLNFKLIYAYLFEKRVGFRVQIGEDSRSMNL